MTAPGRYLRVATVTVALAALGCSGEPDTSPASRPLAEYQAQANAICATAVDAMHGVVQPAIEHALATIGAEPFDAERLQRFYQALIDSSEQAEALIDDMLEELRRLDPPDRQASELRQLWDDIDATMERARRDVVTAAGDPDAARQLWDLETSPFTPVDGRAAALGVARCALDR